MKHIAIFNNSGDVQTALNEETLVNPYVAKVSGALDYNSLQPVGPCYLGEWSDDGAGNYTFQINDTGATAWENLGNIGQLLNVHYNGDEMDMDVLIQFDGSYAWSIHFVPVGGDPSEGESYDFNQDNPDTWTSNVMTDPGASTTPVFVNWDGEDTFVLAATESVTFKCPLSMNTINVECE